MLDVAKENDKMQVLVKLSSDLFKYESKILKESFVNDVIRVIENKLLLRSAAMFCVTVRVGEGVASKSFSSDTPLDEIGAESWEMAKEAAMLDTKFQQGAKECE